MSGPVLTVNVGSSSLKLGVVDASCQVLAGRTVGGGDPAPEEFARVLKETPGVSAVAHRVVHGGERFAKPELIDDAVEQAIAELADLAPLHNPAALAGIRAVRDLRPELPAVACFDTAFHRTLPAAAATYAIPDEWQRRWSPRRFGFHGISHAYCARRVAELLDSGTRRLRIVSAHLGAGASLAAIDGDRSVDTTMGFTPMDGLVMATRPGSMDPGLLLWVMRRGEIEPAEAERALDSDAGLRGLSGGSGDMRDLLEAEAKGDERARLALDVYVHRLAGAIAAMSASLGGIDALAFTGGVGENSDEIRRRTCKRLAFLGVELAAAHTADAESDAEISSGLHPVRILRIRAREDLEMAAQARLLLSD